MTAALVGLGGAAVTSIVLFLVFITIEVAGPKLSSGVWLMFFDTYMSWRYTTIAVIATATVALLGAIGFRARESKQAVYAISMRQILLLQLYAFIALGCWSGMRFFAIGKFSDLQRARHHWGKQEWMAFGGEFEGPRGLERDFMQSRVGIDWDRENAALRRAVAEPWLKEIHLYRLQNNCPIDMHVLSEAKKLESVALQYEATSLTTQSHIDSIGNIANLQQLFLFGGDLRGLDLSPLARRESLKMLVVRDVIIDAEKLKLVTRAPGLVQFEIHPSPATFLGRNRVTFQGGELHLITTLPIKATDLDWANPKLVRHVYVRGPELTVESAKYLGALPNLDVIELYCRIDGAALEEIVAKSPARRVVLDGRTVPHDDAAFNRAYAKLLMMPSLLVLEEPEGKRRPEFEGDIDRTRSTMNRIVLRENNKINEARMKLGLKAIYLNPDPATRRQLLGGPPGVDYR